MSRTRRRVMYLSISIVATVVALALFVRWVEPRLAFVPFTGESETPHDFGLAYEPLTIDTRDGEHLRAWMMPATAPRARIVYFHGNGGNLSNWSPIVAGIVRHGYSVLAVDYRGYGVSTGRPTEQGLYRDAEAVIAHAWPPAGDRGPLVYWGRSLGTAMAAYAATVRKPDALIIEAGFPDARSAVRESPILTFLSLFSSYRFPVARFVNAAGVRVLQLHGDRDSVMPIALGRELAAQITGAHEFFVIAGGDHNDPVARDAGAYWSAIDRFIAKP